MAGYDKAQLLVQSIFSILKPNNVTREDFDDLVNILMRRSLLLEGGDELIQTLAHIALELESNEQKAMNYQAAQQHILQEQQATFTHPIVTSHGKRTPEQTNKLQDWLVKHMDNPYPTDDEKQQLANECNMSLKQINYWFTNARRRLLPVLRKVEGTHRITNIDSSDSSSHSSDSSPQISDYPVKVDNVNTV